MKFLNIITSLGAATLALSAALPAAELESKVEFRAIADVTEPPPFVTDGGIDIPGAVNDRSLVPKAGALFDRDMSVMCGYAECIGSRFIHPQHESEMWHAFDRYYGGGFRVKSYQTYCIKCRGGVIAFSNIVSYSIDVTRNDWLRSYDCLRPLILSGKSRCFLGSLTFGYHGGWRVGAVQEFDGYDGCIEGC
ncbi:hypothetical protein GLAREA_00613 [Glarea lozoyensis ATCC 20868]|uniref:Uncharacterized protein n=1 Tax=Glarea lozoyensis (strain ATCC 20868 / MF5171) TaxID=1116229 RepID=S3DSP6_GLAL2|nr:uncharacterized protein GLAREA_00613 [Glarea lozoyensis ATCC 20868]EPE29453.1 hypothetical protein GLAREA_00613 [Glarea lozoyensis ATCC 20868]